MPFGNGPEFLGRNHRWIHCHWCGQGSGIANLLEKRTAQYLKAGCHPVKRPGFVISECYLKQRHILTEKKVWKTAAHWQEHLPGKENLPTSHTKERNIETVSSGISRYVWLLEEQYLMDTITPHPIIQRGWIRPDIIGIMERDQSGYWRCAKESGKPVMEKTAPVATVCSSRRLGISINGISVGQPGR